jgi:CBS domain containing-hemolysin-like protein
VIDIFAGSLLLTGVLLFDMVFAITRSAFINSHIGKLKELDGRGIARAGLALRVASEASPLILSLRATHSIIRLVVIGVALVTYTPSFITTSGSNLLVIGVVLLGTGLLISLLEFLGESIALRDPERWAVRMVPLAAAIVNLMTPMVWLMMRVAGWISGGAIGRSHPLVTEEEIMTLVDAGEEEGVIEEEEKAMIFSIFQLADTLAREVMVPRIDMLTLEASTSLVEATETLLRTGHSRTPVYSGTIDNIVGLLNAKDLLAAWLKGEQNRTVAHLLREAYFVPEAKKVGDLLAELQAKRVHMAIVVDEYGGTAGLVTIEDVIEEIVGEIRDEYDYAEEIAYQVLQEGEYIFSGLIDLDDVNQLTGARLPKDTSDTLGGFIYSQLSKVPSPGEVVEAGGLHLVVEEVSGRRIRKVRAHRVEDLPAEKDNDGNNKTAQK